MILNKKGESNIWGYIDMTVVSGVIFKCILIKSSHRTFPRGVMVKSLDYELEVSEFEFQSHLYVYFRTNTLGKGMNHLIFPATGQIVPLLSFSIN